MRIWAIRPDLRPTLRQAPYFDASRLPPFPAQEAKRLRISDFRGVREIRGKSNPESVRRQSPEGSEDYRNTIGPAALRDLERGRGASYELKVGWIGRERRQTDGV